jgi:ADP-ribosylglycohydrolase
MQAGEVTDGTSQALLLAHVLADGGPDQLGPRYFTALQSWLENSEFAKFIGPTTESALRSQPPAPVDKADGSNGAAMRTAPIGWFTAGDPELAVSLAVDAAKITHTGASVIGAAMIAAAVSVATAGSSLDAALTAAENAIDQSGRLIDAPESAALMKRSLGDAITSGHRASTTTTLQDRLSAFTHPTTTAACGSVAAAFGCVVAAKQSPFNAVVLATNAGDDTHTTAMMAGAIAGSLSGTAAFPAQLLRQLSEVNAELHDIDLDATVNMVVSALALRPAPHPAEALPLHR